MQMDTPTANSQFILSPDKVNDITTKEKKYTKLKGLYFVNPEWKSLQSIKWSEHFKGWARERAETEQQKHPGLQTILSSWWSSEEEQHAQDSRNGPIREIQLFLLAVFMKYCVTAVLASMTLVWLLLVSRSLGACPQRALWDPGWFLIHSFLPSVN